MRATLGYRPAKSAARTMARLATHTLSSGSLPAEACSGTKPAVWSARRNCRRRSWTVLSADGDKKFCSDDTPTQSLSIKGAERPGHGAIKERLGRGMEKETDLVDELALVAVAAATAAARPDDCAPCRVRRVAREQVRLIAAKLELGPARTQPQAAAASTVVAAMDGRGWCVSVRL